ncbi:MAG: sensor histidine kinase [Dorea sp.]
MIYSLRKKFIKICGMALAAVLVVIFILILIFSQKQLNSAMDQLTDRIAANGGRFPYKQDAERLKKKEDRQVPGFITEETKFSTRYFTVRFDRSGNVDFAELEAISSVTGEEAVEYAKEAIQKKNSRGWIDSFRFKVEHTELGTTVVFVDGSMNRSMAFMTILVVCGVLLGSFLVVFLFIVFFSKRAVEPIAESYEKQKQFITDANHELKTPLTLILTNLDIVESEIGQNEWLNDIRSESEQMSALVNQLVMLTRMDEGQKNMQFEQTNISAIMSDVWNDFQILAEQKEEHVRISVEPDVGYYGDPNALRHLFTILMDNAVKYCDPDGEITVSLTGGKHPVICVENSYRKVAELELGKLFDRFYRSDRARTYNGSFGIGLSIAKAIVQNHHGKISAYQKNDRYIGFKVRL